MCPAGLCAQVCCTPGLHRLRQGCLQKHLLSDRWNCQLSLDYVAMKQACPLTQKQVALWFCSGVPGATSAAGLSKLDRMYCACKIQCLACFALKSCWRTQGQSLLSHACRIVSECYKELGEFVNAKLHAETALKELQKSLGNKHPSLISFWNEVAETRQKVSSAREGQMN